MAAVRRPVLGRVGAGAAGAVGGGVAARHVAPGLRPPPVSDGAGVERSRAVRGADPRVPQARGGGGSEAVVPPGARGQGAGGRALLPGGGKPAVRPPPLRYRREALLAGR